MVGQFVRGGWQGQERSGWPCDHGETLGIIRTHPRQGHPVGLTLPPADDGYLRLTSNGYFRPTLKGAFLMVWRELWPWKMIRRHQRDRVASELLEDLNRQGNDIMAS